MEPGEERKPFGDADDAALPLVELCVECADPLKIGTDGRRPVGTQRLRLERPPGTKVVLCLHPDGQHSVLAAAPDPKQKPALLFTNRPRYTFLF